MGLQVIAGPFAFMNVGYSLFPVSKGVGGKTEISHFQFLLHIFKDSRKLL